MPKSLLDEELAMLMTVRHLPVPSSVGLDRVELSTSRLSGGCAENGLGALGKRIRLHTITHAALRNTTSHAPQQGVNSESTSGSQEFSCAFRAFAPTTNTLVIGKTISSSERGSGDLVSDANHQHPPTRFALIAVRCPVHGATMEWRSPGTPEQAFCGAWWDCTAPRCSFTVLFESPALRAQLADMRRHAPVGAQ